MRGFELTTNDEKKIRMFITSMLLKK